MALLHSEKIKLGSKASFFDLPSVDGRSYSLSDFQNKILVLMFICNHCPYVKAIEDRILQLVRDFAKWGIAFVGISSNDFMKYPDDSPASLKTRWLEKKYGFPYLIDEDQSVARAYGAVCTPDLFVYNSKHELAYHGRLDDNWQEPSKVTKSDLRLALEALLKGSSPDPAQISSMGCSIKWKPDSSQKRLI